MNTKDIIVIALVVYCIVITILACYLYIKKQTIFDSYLEIQSNTIRDAEIVEKATEIVSRNMSKVYTSIHSGKYIPFNVQYKAAHKDQKYKLLLQVIKELCCDTNTSIHDRFERFIYNDDGYNNVSLTRIDYYLNKGKDDFITFITAYEKQFNKSVVDDFEFYKNN